MVKGLVLALSWGAQGMGLGDKGPVKGQGAVLAPVKGFKEVVPGDARGVGLHHQHERALRGAGVDQEVISAPASGHKAFTPGEAKAAGRWLGGDGGPGIIGEGKGLMFKAGHDGLPEAFLERWAGLLKKPGAWTEGRVATPSAGCREAFAHHNEGEQRFSPGALGKIEEPFCLGRLSKVTLAPRVIRHRLCFSQGPPREGVGGGEDRPLPFPQPLIGRKDGHEPRPSRAAGATVIKVRRPRPAITRRPAVRVSRSVRARWAMRVWMPSWSSPAREDAKA